jgi:hypothetical protein
VALGVALLLVVLRLQSGQLIWVDFKFVVVFLKVMWYDV